ncbi:MAG: alpha/beta fold hydrolase [Caldilineaceae bacterium]|jgi:pimeloyl-ACP methyl ester carboxylesterase
MATFVLVHGTTAGGWVWKEIASQLRAGGHEVYTPTLTGLGEREHLLTYDVGLETHIEDIVNVIRFESLRDVVLVGHGYGGMVITGVAEQIPNRIGELVYFDAFVPYDGETTVGTAGEITCDEIQTQVEEDGEGWLIPVRHGPNDMPARNTPHPWKSWNDPLTTRNPVALALPRTYVRFTADKQEGEYYEIMFRKSWARVHYGRWRIVEVDAPHQILPNPDSRAAVLLDLFEE